MCKEPRGLNFSGTENNNSSYKTMLLKMLLVHVSFLGIWF